MYIKVWFICVRKHKQMSEIIKNITHKTTNMAGPGKLGEDIGASRRLVLRTMNLEEAENAANALEMKGFKTKIVRKKQGGITMYEVWAEKKPEIFEQ